MPPELDVSLSAKAKERSLAYQYPPKFAPDTTLAQRVKTEGEGYEPVKHENTGVNADEALYESYLMPVEEALEKLGKGISADVVKKGLEGIRLRRQMEGSL